jgi:hypothetical protein
MSKGKSNGTESPLTAAAAALDSAVARYAELADQIARAPLTSEKAVERISRAVVDAVESEALVRAAVGALVAAVNGAREEQEKATEVINARGAAIAQKRAELEMLLARFKGIGEVAKALNEAMQKVAAYKPDPYDADGAKILMETLAKIEEGMGECATQADAVAKDALSKDLEDVARQADGLRQQLLSTKNRLALLQKQVGKES